MLFPHEREALIAALRRDLQRESFRMLASAERRELHGANVRMVIRLLELFGQTERHLPSDAEQGG